MGTCAGKAVIEAADPIKTGAGKVVAVQPPGKAAEEAADLIKRGAYRFDRPSTDLDSLLKHQALIRRDGLANLPPKEHSGLQDAYMSNINVDDEKVLEHWSKINRILPVYMKAAQQICVNSEWMVATKILRQIKDMKQGAFKDELKHVGEDPSPFILGVIKRAYRLDSDHKAQQQLDLLSQQPILPKIKQVYSGLEGWKKPPFLLSLKIIDQVERDTGAIAAKLSEVVDRAMHCRQVQVKSFQLIVSHASRLLSAEQMRAQALSNIPDGGEFPVVEVARMAREELDLSQGPVSATIYEACHAMQIVTEHQNVKDLAAIVYKEIIVRRAQRGDDGNIDDEDDEENDDDLQGSSGGGGSEKGGREEKFVAALKRFYECFEDFLDDHKENAFNAAFQEPARFYFAFAHQDQQWRKDNVDSKFKTGLSRLIMYLLCHCLDRLMHSTLHHCMEIFITFITHIYRHERFEYFTNQAHANNWPLALLNAALNVQIPLLAAYWDNWPQCTCDFWAGLTDNAWHHFADPSHFGNSYQGIPALRNGKNFIKRKVALVQLPEGNRDINPAKRFANEHVKEGSNVHFQEKIAVYLERFSYFFSRDFFVKKAFETLNSEFKPEHVGFRKAAQTLFMTYRREQGSIEDDEFVQYCYTDDMYTELDLDKTERFFVWLGVLKPSHRIEALQPAAARLTAVAASASGEKTKPKLARVDSTAEAQRAKAMADINKRIQTAMQQRDMAAIRALMKERDALKRKPVASEEVDETDDGAVYTMEDLRCPITMTLMRDPVKAADGKTYERKAIEDWLRRHNTSPTTNEALSSADLTSDEELKAAIDRLPEEVKTKELGAAAKNENEAVVSHQIFERNLSFTEHNQLPGETVAFIDGILDLLLQAPSKDPQFRAAIFERWQMFEMLTESSRTLRSVAKLIIEDERMHRALRVEDQCLRDTCGLCFRLHGMIVAGEVTTAGNGIDLVEAAVERIVAPFESPHPCTLDGNFVGALYMQTVTPLLSAKQSSMDCKGLEELVRRVGNAIINWFEYHKSKVGVGKLKQQTCNAMHRDFVSAGAELVWGGNDPIGAAFYS